MNIEKFLEKEIWKTFGKHIKTASKSELLYAVMAMIRTELESWTLRQGTKKVYYLSMEILLGKMTENTLLALGKTDTLKEVFSKNGRSLEELEDAETELPMGNGGLGRLTACMVDSMAAQDIPGDVFCCLYRFGLFKQKLCGLMQKEVPDSWMDGNHALTRLPGHYRVELEGKPVEASAWCAKIPGANHQYNRVVFFDLDSVRNENMHDDLTFDESDVEHSLNLLLYPPDDTEEGKRLRLNQEYFLSSSSVQGILKEQEELGHSVRQLHKHVVIQLNDTHCVLAIPVMVRELEKRGLTRDEALAETNQMFAYTCHTIMAEALERWPESLLRSVAPEETKIICDMNSRVMAMTSDPSLHIIQNREVHMARLAIHGGFSVNGVAELHTNLLKKRELAQFYHMYPDKFSNKTNGITFRKWLLQCNPRLTDLLVRTIGPDFILDSTHLSDFTGFCNDQSVLNELICIKEANKADLSAFLKKTQNVDLPAGAIFDVQCKRFHEYKRQIMNLLGAVSLYLDIEAGFKPKRPIVLMFGGKAAASYERAKDTIHAILCLGELIRRNPQVSRYMSVVMVENYNVTKAGLIMAAADISEQISLITTEASGTGNMKFMLNGAVTLGTLDGANVEIAQCVGADNICIFGRSADEVMQMQKDNSYRPRDYYNRPAIRPLVDFLASPEMCAVGNGEVLRRLRRDLIERDRFMALLDLEDYMRARRGLWDDYEDRKAWARMCLLNIAQSGFFSSDRMVQQYNADIWHI